MFETLAPQMREDHSPLEVLRAAQTAQQRARLAEVDLLQCAFDWAVRHPARLDAEDAASFVSPGAGLGEFDVAPVVGTGCPSVTEAACAEFGAALGLTTAAAKRMIGHALELQHRLPQVWAAVRRGTVDVWRARRVAEATITSFSDHTSVAAAAWVDRQLAPQLGRVTPRRIEKVIEAARLRFDLVDPDVAPVPPVEDQTRVGVELHHVRQDGTVEMSATLTLADALDLEHALRHHAEQARVAGSSAGLDSRRASALGHLARMAVAGVGSSQHDVTDHLGVETAGAGIPGHLSPAGGATGLSALADRPGNGSQPPHAPTSHRGTEAEVPGNGGADSRGTETALISEDIACQLGAFHFGARHPVAPLASGPHTSDQLAGGPHATDQLPGAAVERTTCDAPSDSVEALPTREIPKGRSGTPDAATGTPARRLDLRLHVTAHALTSAGLHVDPLGRLEQPDHPVLLEWIARWARDTFTQVRILPVLDLHESRASTSQHPPPLLRRHVQERDGSCVFPWCDGAAATADLDHIEEYDPNRPASVQTTTANLACLCRRHHRLKTFTGWNYEQTAPGTYRWRSPLGLEYLRTPSGTVALT